MSYVNEIIKQFGIDTHWKCLVDADLRKIINKTIERCAQVAEKEMDGWHDDQGNMDDQVLEACSSIIKNIRKLKEE